MNSPSVPRQRHGSSLLCLALPCLALLSAGCSKTPVTETQPSDGAPQASAAPSTKPAPVSAPSAPAPLAPGCYDGIPEEPAAALTALATNCAGGMTGVLPSPLEVELKAGERRVVPVTIVDISKCLRAAAVGSPDTQLSLELLARDDSSLGNADFEAHFAVLNREGPICFSSPGQYRVVLKMKRGAGKSLVQIWLAQ